MHYFTLLFCCIVNITTQNDQVLEKIQEERGTCHQLALPISKVVSCLALNIILKRKSGILAFFIEKKKIFLLTVHQFFCILHSCNLPMASLCCLKLNET